MHRINYAGGSILTGSAIATALIAYAQALAQHEDSATVEIPVRTADGSVGSAQLLIGPASQLIAETEVSSFDEIEDSDLIARLTSSTSGLTNSAIVEPNSAAAKPAGGDSFDVDFEAFVNTDPSTNEGE